MFSSRKILIFINPFCMSEYGYRDGAAL